jgi:hypothetical protein
MKSALMKWACIGRVKLVVDAVHVRAVMAPNSRIWQRQKVQFTRGVSTAESKRLHRLQ